MGYKFNDLKDVLTGNCARPGRLSTNAEIVQTFLFQMGGSQSQGPTRGSSRASGQSTPQTHVRGRPQAVDAILRSSKVRDNYRRARY